ncbi:MAG: YheU family protein [Deltaproteobacteria bacterium]|uniref:YheU family protein n=1 Tax=Desulfobacula sp. TaxID=2593537 RepID=UPI00199CC94F|nr:YheU family protein [Candidatus Desulfobacula maris]MBL6994566.1 YheU family protein [Desulfobacula sp.]
MTAVKIPYNQLSPEAQHGIVEEFVTREGTDYGDVEVPLETKIAQVLGQLKSGKAVIVFDQGSETCNILRSDDSVLEGIRD